VERAATPGAAAFSLQSVVLEYVTNQLVEEVAEEIERSHPALLIEQPLIKAQAKEYVRQTQERLIGTPVLRLGADCREEGTARLLALLDGLRALPEGEQGFASGTLVNLLRLQRGDLRGLDLSRLVLRQAYLAQVDAQDASLVDAHLVDTVLAEAFDFPSSVALSGDAVLLAAGTSTGQVWLWRIADRTAPWAVQAHTGAVRALALSADGRMVASGGRGWDCALMGDRHRPSRGKPGGPHRHDLWSGAVRRWPICGWWWRNWDGARVGDRHRSARGSFGGPNRVSS
jgi:hypothetical protein